MTGTIQGFGRPLPVDMQDRVAVTWGARAIYTGQQIDIVWDRQTWTIPGVETMKRVEHKPIVDRLDAWLQKKGLPFLRKQALTLFPEENRTVSLDDGLFHIEANPQSSYGYLYIRAWEAKAPEVVPGTRAIGHSSRYPGEHACSLFKKTGTAWMPCEATSSAQRGQEGFHQTLYRCVTCGTPVCPKHQHAHTDEMNLEVPKCPE